MTTSVKITTHDWPVKVTCRDKYHHHGPTSRSRSEGVTEEFIPANSERDIAVTDSRAIIVEELPKGVIDLDLNVGPAEEAADAAPETPKGEA